MKKHLLALTHYGSIPFKQLFLLSVIIKTYFKRKLQFFKKNPAPIHLNTFLNHKKIHSCNLDSLEKSLNDQKDGALQVSRFLVAQKTYTSKDELVKTLCEFEEDKEIIAIPIAISAFAFTRHFVTIIVDRRENIIEFYDPIGFSIKSYTNASLWGPKCKKKDRLKLSTLIEEVKKKYNINKVIENRQIDQRDFNQCAVYVFDRIYKRGILNLNFENACKTPLCSNYVYIN